MRELSNYILEKLDLNKVNLNASLRADNFKNYQEAIKALKELAKNHKLEVRFRDKQMPSGDFCIFIYDKRVQKSYIVGFDGSWNGMAELNFARCYQEAVDFIENYKR